MKIDPHSTLLMIGDSITDCGCSGASLGNGYVRLVHEALQRAYPQSGIRIINKGISGNTIRNLKRRWQRDVLDLEPDWLSIMIGINDVWQQFGGWLPKAMWVSIEEYEQTLSELLSTTAPSLKGLILMSPYYLQPDKADPLRVRMDHYGDIVREYAKKYDAIFVDTQATFDNALEKIDRRALSEDRVHMNVTGHGILAGAFLKAVE